MMIELTNYLNPDQKTYVNSKAVSAVIGLPNGDGSNILVEGIPVSVKELPAEVREKMVAAQ
jgi:hypothetical protein